jgi:hypothetical protein
MQCTTVQRTEMQSKEMQNAMQCKAKYNAMQSNAM